MMFPSDLIDLPIVLLGSTELDLLLLKLQLAIILGLHKAELILLLAGLGICHINLFDQLLSFDFV
jgi:hypothetical protein